MSDSCLCTQIVRAAAASAQVFVHMNDDYIWLIRGREPVRCAAPPFLELAWFVWGSSFSECSESGPRSQILTVSVLGRQVAPQLLFGPSCTGIVQFLEKSTIKPPNSP